MSKSKHAPYGVSAMNKSFPLWRVYGKVIIDNMGKFKELNLGNDFWEVPMTLEDLSSDLEVEIKNLRKENKNLKAKVKRLEEWKRIAKIQHEGHVELFEEALFNEPYEDDDDLKEAEIARRVEQYLRKYPLGRYR